MKNCYRVFEYNDIRQYQEKPLQTILESTQLSRGKFHGVTDWLRLDNVRMSRCVTNQTVRDVARLPAGFVAFIFHEHESSFYLKGRYYGRGGLSCAGGDKDWEGMSHRDSRHITFLLPRDYIAAHFTAEQRQKIDHLINGNDEIFVCPQPYLTPVLELANTTFDALTRGELSLYDEPKITALKNRLHNRLADAIDHLVFEDVRANASGRLVDRVLDHINSASDDLKVNDLAESLHTSSRNIELAFKTYIKVTPKEYLVNLRLNRVRAELASVAKTHRSIKDIARRHGFSHMGNFSRAYFKLFLELPSETVKHYLESEQPENA